MRKIFQISKIWKISLSKLRGGKHFFLRLINQLRAILFRKNLPRHPPDIFHRNLLVPLALLVDPCRIADYFKKSPDVAWVSGDKLVMLDPSVAEDKYLPIVPDFVAEIRSQTDSLKKVKAKMENTWIANGVRLAWLIDPYQEKAYIYRDDGSKDVVKGFDNKLSGEDVLPGFELDLSEFRLFGRK